MVSSASVTDQLSLSGYVLAALEPDAPLALSATDVSPNGFVANWQSVPGASSYLIDLYVNTASGAAEDLFFSEYIEGSSYNKALEIFNGTGSTVNLSDYRVHLFSNGSASVSSTLQLSGTLDNGAVYVLAHSNAATDFTSVADYTNSSGVINFNGNDALGLYKVSTDSYLDIFGVIGNDPGSAWTAGSDQHHGSDARAQTGDRGWSYSESLRHGSFSLYYFGHRVDKLSE
ncbi:MAG: lamin tail domain-containing protein [Candidatus Cloacimonetes bacterium]|nr:lamin tail domain-containing protein [Candidatus Cloacimonadota bacterium]